MKPGRTTLDGDDAGIGRQVRVDRPAHELRGSSRPPVRNADDLPRRMNASIGATSKGRPRIRLPDGGQGPDKLTLNRSPTGLHLRTGKVRPIVGKG